MKTKTQLARQLCVQLHAAKPVYTLKERLNAMPIPDVDNDIPKPVCVWTDIQSKGI